MLNTFQQLGFRSIATLLILTQASPLAWSAPPTGSDPLKVSPPQTTASSTPPAPMELAKPDNSSPISQDPCDQKEFISGQTLGQKGEYCAAAKAAEEAAKKQKLLTKVHAGVAALCLVPCVNNTWSFGASEISMGQICSGASIAAGVTDVVMTKQFTGLAGSLVSAYTLMKGGAAATVTKAGAAAGGAAAGGAAAGGAAAGGAAAGGAAAGGAAAGGAAAGAGTAAGAAAKGGYKGSKMSCATAALETVSAFMSSKGAKSSEETAKQNREAAAKLISQALNPAIASAAMGKPASIPSGTTSGSSASGFSNLAGGGLSSSSSGSNQIKGQDMNSCSRMGFSAQVNCAINAGLKLPPGVNHPAFAQALETASRIPIDQLMGHEDPKSIIGAGVGAALNPSQKAQLADILSKAERELGTGPSLAAATYSTGGGSGGGGSGGSDSTLNNALGNLMDGLKHGEGGETGPSNQEVSFQGEGATGANSASTLGDEENRTLSIFVRVSRRYQANLGQFVLKRANTL